MFKIVKKHGKTVQAWRLGESSPVIDRLIREKKLISLPDGTWEIMSREALLGGTGHGQIALPGDYIKQDSDGYPYPNSAAFFEKRHRPLGGDTYEQIPSPLDAWTVTEPMCPEIQYLQDGKGLIFNSKDKFHYFSAPLWGTIESAPKDAVLVFYSITRDEQGLIADADFNFVDREEFEKLYDILPKTGNSIISQNIAAAR